jgi:hypothetical protein
MEYTCMNTSNDHKESVAQAEKQRSHVYMSQGVEGRKL